MKLRAHHVVVAAYLFFVVHALAADEHGAATAYLTIAAYYAWWHSMPAGK